MRAITRDLQGGHFGQVEAERAAEIGGVFYAEVSETELEAIIRSSEGSPGRVSSPRYEPARPPYLDGLWHAQTSDDDLKTDPRGVLVEKLAGEGREAVLSALADSLIVAIEPSGHAEALDRLIWNLYWCLPPLHALNDGVVAALRESTLQPFAGEREEPPRLRRGLYSVFHGTPSHLWLDGAPVVVAALGSSTTVPMPKGLAAPADFAAVRGAVSDSATGLITSMVFGADDAALDGDELTAEQLAERRAPRAWLARNDGAVALSEEARAAFNFVAAAANRRLPDFLTERYRLRLDVASIERWFEEEPLQLAVVPAKASNLVETFAVEHSAEGFQLWMQLAVLNALEDTGRVESQARLLAAEWYDAETEVGHSEAPEEDVLEAVRDAQRRFNALREALLDFAASNAEWLDGEAAETVDTVPADSWTGGGHRTRRLLVIDEPERHLQPRLQRQAAKWLAATSRAVSAPTLIATHSPAFLSLPPETTTFVSLHRSGREARARAFDAAQLDALSDLSRDMGYDRGELVSSIALWWVVEGETDKAVIETLYGERLAAAGIEIVPLHGTSKWQVLLEADALWRFTAAPVAVMFDGIGPERVAQLNALSDGQLKEHARSSSAPGEERDMAQLLRRTRALGRTVHPVPNEGADIFELLDESAIRHVFEQYPGHAEARDRWSKHAKGSHDSFLKNRYSVEKTPGKFGAVASEMRTAGAVSSVLEDAITFCETLAL